MVQTQDPWAVAEPDSQFERLPVRVLLQVALPTIGVVVGAFRGEVSGAEAGWMVLVAFAWAGSLLLVAPRGAPGLLGVLVTPVLAAALLDTVAGRGAVVVVLWSVALCDLALAGPWSERASRGSGAPLMRTATLLAVPAGFTAADGRADVGVILVIAFTGILVWAAGNRCGARRVDRRFGEWIQALGSFLANALTLVLAIPLLYVPGALVRWSRSAGARQYPTGSWVLRTVQNDVVRRDSTAMFASTAPELRRVRLRNSACLIGVVTIAVVATGDIRFVERRSASTFTEADSSAATGRAPNEPAVDPVRPYSTRRAFQGVEFADELQGEQDRFLNQFLVPDPETTYVSADHEGRYTNTLGGARRSLQPTDCDCREAKVWVLGGSAAFGIGQRDEHTIASELVRIGADNGWKLNVVNLAVPGWVLPQEVDTTGARLAEQQPPDLVVFYDGYNDAFLTLAHAAVSGGVQEEVGRLDDEAFRELRRRLDTGGGVMADLVEDLGGANRVGVAAAEHYAAFREQAESMLGASGVESRFFFQTDAMFDEFHRQDATEVEPALNDPADAAAWDNVIAAMENALESQGVVSLRRAPEDTAEAVFIDSVHTNELGARVVAQAMWNDVSIALENSVHPE